MPALPFHLAAKGTQKYRIVKLAEEHTLDELIAAAEKRAIEDKETDFSGTLRKLNYNLKMKRRKSAKSADAQGGDAQSGDDGGS